MDAAIIMGRLSSSVVDVRDMLCAQALAVVARAMESLQPGQAIEVHFNTPEVQHDLLVWAAARGFEARGGGTGALRMGRVT